MRLITRPSQWRFEHSFDVQIDEREPPVPEESCFWFVEERDNIAAEPGLVCSARLSSRTLRGMNSAQATITSMAAMNAFQEDFNLTVANHLTIETVMALDADF